MQNPSYQQTLTTIKIIHWAITIMPVMFGGFVLFINTSNPMVEQGEANPLFMYLPILVAIIAVPASRVVFKAQIKNVTEGQDLIKKLRIFQTAHIVRLSLLEVAGIMAAVCSLITSTFVNLGLLAVIFVLMALLAPNSFKVAETLGLSPEERQILE